VADRVHRIRCGIPGLELAIDGLDVSGALEHVRQITRDMGGELIADALAEKGMELIEARGALLPESQPVADAAGRGLTARCVLIATGSRPKIPPVPGLTDVPYLTNQTLFGLPQPPRSMVILGAGPIGIEMAQAFNRLGTRVTVVDRGSEILSQDDPEHARWLREILEGEGVEFLLGSNIVRARLLDGQPALVHEDETGERTIAGEELLVAAGREPNTGGLGLDEAGIEHSPRGVEVDDLLRTTRRGIYAVGDVNGRWPFSHMAEYESTIATSHALFGLRRKASYRDGGWCTFTDPEVASCGINAAEAEHRGLAHGVHRWGFDSDDRARVDGQGVGEVKVVADPHTGRLLGAQIIGPRAGEAIQEYVLALRRRIPVHALAQTVHVYPTVSVTAQRASQMWMRDRLQVGWTSRLARQYLGLRGFGRGG
jgi:pyruvate/2-oxoglutarate dehydrogenase complex dihydrolipoamide dehydrogenase (E3) component